MKKAIGKIMNKEKFKDVDETTDIVDCPRCGNPADWYFEHANFKQIVICKSCGYASTDKIIRGRPTSKLYHHEHLGAGAYHIAFKEGGKGQMCGSGGVLPDPHKEKVDWEEILSWFRKIMKDPEVDPDGCFLTKYDEKTGKIIPLIGHPLFTKIRTSKRVDRGAQKNRKKV